MFLSKLVPKFLKEFFDDYQNVKLQLQETCLAMEILQKKCHQSRIACERAYEDMKREYDLTRQHNRELQQTATLLREEVVLFGQENEDAL
jgi:hypothetical protein